jgi:BirA family biotin operon repressor/biotin-[acetyl-CoA-carboxylase] ligase
VLVSVNLRPTVPSARLPELTVVGGEAVADAIAQETGLRPELKFPNDVLIAGRKVAGILAEARDDRVVLGIGINVNLASEQLPQDVDTPPTSLQIEHEEPIDRAKLLAAVLARLETAYAAWISEAGRAD